MLAISRGETVCGKRPRIVDIMDAIKWLADRGWGKAVQPQEMTGDDGGPVTVILRRDRDF